MRIFVSILSIFILAACAKPLVNPSYLPAGYTYHHDQYKSPPGPNPWGIGYDYTAAQNAETLDRWREVSINILDKIEFDGDILAQDIFLAPPKLDNAFTQSLDHTIREELRARSYRLVNLPGPDTLILALETYDPEFKDAMRSFIVNGDIKEAERPEPPALTAKELALTARALRADQTLANVEGRYILPLYGYEDKQLYFPISQDLAEVWR